MAGLTYTIKKNLINKSLLIDVECDDKNVIRTINGEDVHYLFLAPLDSGIDDCPWGRLKINLSLPQNTMCYMYVVANNSKEKLLPLLDPDKNVQDKKEYYHSLGGARFINKDDVVLYHSQGRYLSIGFEFIGADISIAGMKAYAPGDNFMQVFPQVYRENNSFFHRYISVYSSIYNDFQAKLDSNEYLFDVENAPVNLLYLYAKWMGIDISGDYLDEETLRKLLKDAGKLLPKKGTGYAVEKLCEIVIGERPTIIERCLLDNYIKQEDRKHYDDLYGDNPYAVTLLVKQFVSERKKEQLLHLLEQFKPVRTKLNVVFLEESGVLDGYSYMDSNAITFYQTEGVLDGNQVSDGTIVLE